MNLIQHEHTINTETQKSIQNQHEAKLQKLILDLNKAGLKLITEGINIMIMEGNFEQAIDYLKKAQKVILKQGLPQQSSPLLLQLSGITFNNLACYYKKTKKPKVALKYLKKALQIQVFRVSNWTSIAGTHLNICAIYSFMKNHQQAANHAQLAISFLQKVNFDDNDNSEEAKSYFNVYMLSFYNLAIEKEYLKQYEDAIKCYKKSKEIAQNSGKRNVSILISCDEAICRLQPMVQNLRKKMILSIQKRQQSDEKGFAEYICFNKKNFGSKKQNQYYANLNNQEQLKKILAYNETPTSTAGKFRSRRVPNSTKAQTGTHFNKRVHSLSAFNNKSTGNVVGQERNMRLMTQNDVEDRGQVNGYSNKMFKRTNRINTEC